MMDCTNAEIRDMLPDYAAGRLPRADRETVEAHLAGCDDCSSELSLVRSARRALAPAPAVDVGRIVAALPAPRREAIPGVVPIDSRRRARSAPGGWGAPRRVAAIAAAIVAAAGLTLSGIGRTPGPGADAPTGITASGATDSPVESVSPGTSPSGSVQLASASTELSLAAGVSELSDESLRALLGDLDDLDDATITEPAAALPAVTGLDDESGV